MRILLAALAVAIAAASASPAIATQSMSRLVGAADEPTLLIRRQAGPGAVVLYVHGATFPSASSIAYRIGAGSWMDDLRGRGFDVWAFDFAGFGGSDRPRAMTAADGPPVLRAPEAADQIGRVIDHIRSRRPDARVVVLAHSWGTIPAALFATRRPDAVDRLMLFGPVAVRRDEAAPFSAAAYPMTAEDQWAAFQSGLPEGQASLIDRSDFDAWFADYLAGDPGALDRDPAAVMVPGGPQADLLDAWSGRLAYDPAGVRAPTLIVRGEWDSVTSDADAAWLAAALAHAPGGAVDLKLPQGGHRMHLERNRQVLFDAVGAWLSR